MNNIKGRTLVVGDIHGQFEALENALNAAEFNPDKGDFLIMLGDLIDRGYGSKETLDFAIELVESGHGLVLRGNHEQMALDAYDFNDFTQWFNNGGEVAHKQILGESKYINFMRSLPYIHEIGTFIFTHAGFNPELPLDEQDIDDMLWIREKYICSDIYPDRIIITGHTPVQCFGENQSVPLKYQNKIFMDTGAAYASYGGMVSVMDIHSECVWQSKCITK